MGVTEAQKKAHAKWEKNNKERRQYINKRSASRSFISKLATIEDLQELLKLIHAREKELTK